MFSLLFAVLLALPESPQPPPTPTPEAQIQHQIRDEEKSESTPVAQPVVVPTRSGEKAKPSRDNRDDESANDRNVKSPIDWKFVFAFVIALGAVVQIFAVFYQGHITRAQLRATQKSADAATQSTQNIRIFNRAKVIIDELRFQDVGVSIRAFYKVRNIGKTTAYIYERIDTVQIIDNPLPDIPPALDWIPNKEPFDLAPDRDDVNFGGGAFEKLFLKNDKFLDGKAELYALGVIKYRDDFGSEWETRYAWQYRRTGPAFVVNKAGYNAA